jgi:hypothetical protein
MSSDRSSSNRVMQLLMRAPRALTRAELTDAYIDTYGEIDTEFRHEIENLNRDGKTSINMMTAAIDYGLDVLPTPWSPTTRIYFSSEKQISKWIEYIRERPPDTNHSALPPERIRKILKACESGVSKYDAVHQTGAGLNAVNKYYNIWKSVPSEALEGVLDGEGATVSEARAIASRRLNLPLSDSLVRNKLDLMVLMEHHEKIEINGETRYRTKR